MTSAASPRAPVVLLRDARRATTPRAPPLRSEAPRPVSSGAAAPRRARCAPTVRLDFTRRPLLALAGIVLAGLALAGCYFTRSPSRPVPALEFRREASVRQHCLVVFLPGFLDGPETYLDHRFPHALNGSGAPCDAVGLDLHVRYYSQPGIAEIVYSDVLVPATARGYTEIWLVGISMGGLGTLLTASRYAELVDGVILIAPFVGEERVLRGIEEAGGLAAWDPPEGIEGAPWTEANYTEHVWAWLQGYDDDPSSMPPLYLGWGEEDSLGPGDGLLGAVLPEGHVFSRPGGHNWAVWTPIWQDILRRAPVGRVSPPYAAP